MNEAINKIRSNLEEISEDTRLKIVSENLRIYNQANKKLISLDSNMEKLDNESESSDGEIECGIIDLHGRIFDANYILSYMGLRNRRKYLEL